MDWIDPAFAVCFFFTCCGLFRVCLVLRIRVPDLKPSIHTFSTMINACVRCGEIESAMKYFRLMQDSGVQPNVVIHTTLIKGLVKEGHIQRAMEIFRRDLCEQRDAERRPNIRTCDTMLRGCVRWGEAGTALEVFTFMSKEGISPTMFSFEYLIKSLCINLRLAEALEWAGNMERAGLTSGTNAFLNIAVCAGLLGDIPCARRCLKKSEAVIQLPRKQQFDPDAEDRFKSGPGTGPASKYSVDMFDRFRARENKAEQDRVTNFLKALGEERSLRDHFARVREQSVSLSGLQGSVMRFGIGWRFPQVVLVSDTMPDITRLFVTLRDGSGERESVVGEIPAAGRNRRPMFVEVGSGNGDWICRQARDSPETDWVAVELRVERAFEIWSKIEFEGIRNLVVICGNAHRVFAQFCSPDSLDGVYINYPTPPVSYPYPVRVCCCLGSGMGVLSEYDGEWALCLSLSVPPFR